MNNEIYIFDLKRYLLLLIVVFSVVSYSSLIRAGNGSGAEKGQPESSNESAVSSSSAQIEANVEAEAVEEVFFNVWEYRIEGNTLLADDVIQRAVYPHMGPDKTIDDVENARQALETAYVDNGYGNVVFIDIPEQEANNGIIVLKVTEGKVKRVAITGSRYHSLKKIREKVPSLKEGETPYLPEFQEEVTELNKGYIGREITPVLRPGEAPGTVEVELKVKDEFPLHADIELNDRFSPNTNELRLNASIGYDNLWQLGHSASIGYIVAPEDPSEVEVIFGTYVMRVPETELALAFFGVDSSSDVATTGDINQVGKGNIFGFRGIYSLPVIDRFNHNVTLGVDYKDFEETTSLLGITALDTPVSYISFITGYSANWFHDSGKTNLSLNGILAPRGLGNTNQEFSDKRVGAKPNFAILKAKLKHERGLYFDTLLKLRMEAQFADSPLINNEQFTVGGLDTVRGYAESQQLADDGLLASVELQTPSLHKFMGEMVNEFHFKAFADAARVKIQEPLPDQRDRFSLASVGAGMDMKVFDHLNAEFLWAMALKDNSAIDSGDSRLHFKVGYEF